MEFSAKVRAGRAALSWTREDLAAAAGVSAPAIKNIETGASSPTAATQGRICRGFENAGVFFTSEGLEYRKDRIRFVNSFLEVLEDAARDLRPGDEICLHCADERKNSPAVTAKFQALQRAGVGLRFTIEAGNSFITTVPDNYRTIDPGLVASAEVSVIYGDKYVLHVRDEDHNVYLLIKNSLLADVRRREFEYWWRTGGAYAQE